MRTDHLFYKLFETFPETLFVLAGTQPPAPGSYRFEFIEVKETALRIDGVLVPEAAELPYYVYKLGYSREELEAMFGLEELKNTRYFREVAQQAREQGELAVVSRLLTRRFGLLEEALLERLSQLSSAQLESLAEVLLDLADRSELEQWLQQQRPQL
ncbi:DUF2887 domain-containing protein [Gloeobacter morelensis]|uniref:DUF2887 domain-containing protein n=1 Tax=Gloeobacter morelensis MG652769 TaxID=2781736 RepID=A0ABY3PMD7_9CYAN|nr:DUF2887 domain-containing protein [Gloeobacter morelensis]UFP94780.1 DUF2887 domain-containing protein [Gloeobacter morelensis MG652769]